MHDAYISGQFRWTKITRIASDAAENLQFHRIVRNVIMHDANIGERSENASCMTNSGGRTEQVDIFCCITGFTSDFLSFIAVEHIRFFHGAL